MLVVVGFVACYVFVTMDEYEGRLRGKGVNIALIGPLDGMEMIPHLSLVLIADWYLVANDRRR